MTAEAAGDEVMRRYGCCQSPTLKLDNSPVTEADLCADAVIRERLGAAFPDVFILSEESAERPVLDTQRLFIVDPLDGTKEFLNRSEEFTVNIALVDKGVPVAGVVVAPALGEVFYAANGLGAWKRKGGIKTALRVSHGRTALPLRIIGSRSHNVDAVADWLARLPLSHTFVAVGSSLKFCRIAEGSADAYPRFGPTSQWDTAAGQCILESAGGAVADLSGRALLYGLDRPIVNPPFIAFGNPRLRRWLASSILTDIPGAIRA
ncbi:3'(2'),5'-bisphosphate nucleotidase [Paraburkholderia sp. BL17N1]|nr:3'(2'),5'-bisphosphate nucleotidase [Paraburkholderia sp. BL17N1]